MEVYSPNPRAGEGEVTYPIKCQAGEKTHLGPPAGREGGRPSPWKLADKRPPCGECKIKWRPL